MKMKKKKSTSKNGKKNVVIRTAIKAGEASLPLVTIVLGAPGGPVVT